MPRQHLLLSTYIFFIDHKLLLTRMFAKSTLTANTILKTSIFKTSLCESNSFIGLESSVEHETTKNKAQFLELVRSY